MPDPDTAPASDASPRSVAEIEAELALLAAESRERRRELVELAAALPAAQSRRVVIVSMGRDLAAAPDRWGVLRRVGSKILRLPADLVRLLRRR